MDALRGLGRFARPAPRRRVRSGDACEICAAGIGEPHPHVVDLERRAIRCACDTCARLFVQPGAARGRFRTVPARVLHDPALTLTAAEWARLGMPVQLAFLFQSSAAKAWIAIFPGAAGATEADVAPEALAALAAKTALVACAEPDVEALLVHGARGAEQLECLLVPITACYDLVARVRRHWRGFEGGDDVRREIGAAVAALRGRARPLRTRGVGGAA
jgi:hypothetical protein